MRQLTGGLAALLVFAAACSPVEVENTGPLDYTVQLEKPAFGYQIATAPHVVHPGEEYYSCDIVRIDPQNGENLAWIGGLESRTSVSSHHMNVNLGIFSVADALLGEGQAELMLGKELGQYDCAELGDLMEKQQAQTLYPSQRTEQGGTLPEGVGLPLPLPLVLVMEHHYINTFDAPVNINAVLNLHRMQDHEVKHVVTGFSGGINDVLLPPESRKIETGTCKLKQDINVFAISSHSHERGACFTMNLYDELSREVDPTPFFVNKDWESPPILFFEQSEYFANQPLAMKAGEGIHWACHYYNDENREVTTGASSDDEMCIFVALGYPSKYTPDDVRDLMQNPNLEAAQALMNQIPCESVADAESPWEEADIAYAIDDDAPLLDDTAPEAAPSFRSLHASLEHDMCREYDQTE